MENVKLASLNFRLTLNKPLPNKHLSLYDIIDFVPVRILKTISKIVGYYNTDRPLLIAGIYPSGFVARYRFRADSGRNRPGWASVHSPIFLFSVHISHYWHIHLLIIGLYHQRT
jgi:hypothetical protein